MGTGPYPVNRNRTIFTTSLVPRPDVGVDAFMVYYGAADGACALPLRAVPRLDTFPPRARARSTLTRNAHSRTRTLTTRTSPHSQPTWPTP